MKQLIKRILTEGTNPKMDKILNLLQTEYPNPIENVIGSINYLTELGFNDKEVFEVFKYYIKNVFDSRPVLDTYYQIFDSIFQPDDIDYDYEDDFDSDGDGVYIKFTNYTEEGYWNNDEPIMNLYRSGVKSTLELNNYYLNTLNTLFGVKWKQPFKMWFEDRFDEKVKKIV